MRAHLALSSLLFLAFAPGLQAQLHPCDPLTSNCSAPRRNAPSSRKCLTHCRDWAQFSESSVPATITAANVSRVAAAWSVPVPESVDGSPLFVDRAATERGVRSLLIVSTTAGRLLALDALNGETVWRTEPPPGPRWTTSSPALDPDRTFVYVYGLDGYVHKHAVANGAEVTGNGWPELVTSKGDVEKGSSAIAVASTAAGETYLYMTTSAYPDPGDAGDYQGHLVAINLRTGTQRVFNAACSDKPVHFVENGDASSDCGVAQAGIWARAGAVYDRSTDRLFVTTGNGVFDADRGGFNWATTVVALRPDGSTDGGTPLDTYTPAEYQYLNDWDLDLSSTTVAPLQLPAGSTDPPLAVQGGKDGMLRLLDLSDLSGRGGPRHVGGELQVIPFPQSGEILTRPAVWLSHGRSYIALSNGNGTSAFVLDDAQGSPHLSAVWSSPLGCQSPVYTNGILVCAASGRLTAFNAQTGQQLWTDSSLGAIHWQSPIVIGNSIYVADDVSVKRFSLQ